MEPPIPSHVYHGHGPPFNGSNLRSLSDPTIGTRLPQNFAVPIKATPEYHEQLEALVHTQDVLRMAGYVLKTNSVAELAMKKRCSGCGKTMSRLARENNMKRSGKPKDSDSRPSTPLPAKGYGMPGIAEQPHKAVPRLLCKYHSGILRDRVWSCCGGKSSDPPCTGREQHVPKFYKLGEIEKLWQYHSTTGGRKSWRYLQAVAIDCEMGTAVSGDSELIRVTLLDYFSGRTILDKLVDPDVPMLHYNTQYSGVSRVDMANARREGTSLNGRDSARKAVLNFVGPSTIVVGHSAQNDLSALRWIHTHVVDSFILGSTLAKKLKEDTATKHTSASGPGSGFSQQCVAKPEEGKAEGEKQPTKGRGQLSLKTLSKVKLGRDIQVGRNGHDSVEDALASRDLVHRFLTDRGVDGQNSKPSILMSYEKWANKDLPA